MGTSTKRWYASRTLWVNGLAVIAIIGQGLAGREVLSPELQGAVLALVNVLLRLARRQS